MCFIIGLNYPTELSLVPVPVCQVLAGVIVTKLFIESKLKCYVKIAVSKPSVRLTKETHLVSVPVGEVLAIAWFHRNYLQGFYTFTFIFWPTTIHGIPLSFSD